MTLLVDYVPQKCGPLLRGSGLSEKLLEVLVQWQAIERLVELFGILLLVFVIFLLLVCFSCPVTRYTSTLLSSPTPGLESEDFTTMDEIL